ncbi:hypothetical protein M3221_13660 [Domibacillus indicus]|uniref:hypothetical protein n=1 Tax=Domibacillus indicus TaxID=1437523 RepID=UPI00203C73D9|nr:hypothetical protein [Domibacillus indicus]MCM3789447.1 hypothetical protein [Domibacillus indicus]
MKTMKDQLRQWREVNPVPVKSTQKRKQKPKANKKQPAKKKEKLTEQDLRYLMNTNMKTLRRGRGGAYK